MFIEAKHISRFSSKSLVFLVFNILGLGNGYESSTSAKTQICVCGVFWSTFPHKLSVRIAPNFAAFHILLHKITKPTFDERLFHCFSGFSQPLETLGTSPQMPSGGADPSLGFLSLWTATLRVYRRESECKNLLRQKTSFLKYGQKANWSCLLHRDL